LDLLMFAQPPKAAWGRPEFLTDVPAFAQRLSRVPHPRIYHEEHLMRTWGNGILEEESDYILMKDFAAPSYGAAFGVGDIVNYQTLRLKEAEHYRERLATAAEPRPLLDRAGASATVSLDPRAARVERGRLRFALNPGAKPHIFLSDDASGTVRITKDAPGFASAVVDVKETAEVVFSETDYPGWTVRLDGREIERRRFDGIFVSAAVPAGRHNIVFSFNPPSFWLGLFLTLATIIRLIVRLPRRTRARAN
ncbi:MAG: YfhO family protein, partial [Elusimicrobia bacterium]|nr:YfhO family protein [Elusimicrobiota bacterium]